MDYGCRTPFAESLALQTLSYRAMGHQGQQEDGQPVPVPVSLLKSVDRDIEPGDCYGRD